MAITGTMQEQKGYSWNGYFSTKIRTTKCLYGINKGRNMITRTSKSHLAYSWILCRYLLYSHSQAILAVLDTNEHGIGFTDLSS